MYSSGRLTNPPPDPLDAKLSVSEIFGPTFQGEGPSLGRQCAFVRLGGCNLECTWCDTSYTWDWTGKNGIKYNPLEQLAQMTVGAVLDELHPRIEGMDAPMVVISGGEPLLQAQSIGHMVRMTFGGIRWEIETNGTIIPSFGSDYISQFNVSPKLGESGNALDKRFNAEALDWFNKCGRAVFKFVITQPHELKEVAYLQNYVGIPKSRIWIMPQGRNLDIVWGHQKIAEEVIAMGYNMTTRLHVLIWGDKRGV